MFRLDMERGPPSTVDSGVGVTKAYGIEFKDGSCDDSTNLGNLTEPCDVLMAALYVLTVLPREPQAALETVKHMRWAG